MFPESIFGTGDRIYEERFGRQERRFLRRCRKVRPPVLRAFARAAALSAQEMDHWLFLNENSLFRRHLTALTAGQGDEVFLSWFAASLVALAAGKELPGIGENEWECLRDAVGREFGPGERLFTSKLEWLRGEKEPPAALLRLLAETAALLPAAPDLEETITFGILFRQMPAKADVRCRRFLP